MPRTLEEILKSKGFADADLAGMSTLLSDNRFRGAFEDLETERETLKARDSEWDELRRTKYEPALTAAQQDAQKARIRAAELEEQIKIAKEYGYMDDDAQKRADAAAAEARRAVEGNSKPGNGGFNPNDPAFSDFAGNFAKVQGDAMALHNYVAEEYRNLNGQSINSYRGRSNGKAGMPGLLADARAAGKSVDVFAEEAFGWAEKRRQAEAKRQEEFVESIRKEERTKIMLEQGKSLNPNLQMPQASRNPFIPRPEASGGQPWEKSSVDRRNARIQRATETQLKSLVQ